jgi:hypothetical protein
MSSPQLPPPDPFVAGFLAVSLVIAVLIFAASVCGVTS